LVFGSQLYHVVAHATNTNDKAYSGSLLVHFTSSDPSIATIDGLTGTVLALRVGHVTFYAETWAYGVAARDSLPFDITFPVSVTISALPVVPTGQISSIVTFWPQAVTVGIGASVSWTNPSYTDSLDVVFDDPTNVDSVLFLKGADFSTGSGNIASWVRDTAGTGYYSGKILQWLEETGSTFNYKVTKAGGIFSYRRVRTFPVAGTYHYHSVRWGTTGTIYVQ
jgi:hypothetical protein